MELEALKEIVYKWASETELIRKAYIFGSRARGTETQESDLDVAVQLNTLPGDGSEYATWFFTNKELASSLQKKLPIKLQLEWYDPDITKTIQIGILQSSVLVYEQTEI